MSCKCVELLYIKFQLPFTIMHTIIPDTYLLNLYRSGSSAGFRSLFSFQIVKREILLQLIIMRNTSQCANIYITFYK